MCNNKNSNRFFFKCYSFKKNVNSSMSDKTHRKCTNTNIKYVCVIFSLVLTLFIGKYVIKLYFFFLVRKRRHENEVQFSLPLSIEYRTLLELRGRFNFLKHQPQ